MLKMFNKSKSQKDIADLERIKLKVQKKISENNTNNSNNVN